MKKTTKISLMSGLVTVGVLLCGVHIANAQTNIDTGYTITIPSEVGIDKDSGKGSFSVSGKMDAQTELDVTTTSQNDYKLKCGSQFIDYTLDKQSFHIDNIKSANPKNFNEDFNITLANTNTNYSGPYKDRLAFNIQCHQYTYELDMNSILDGKVEFGRHNYGTVDVYINGERVADDVSDFNGNYPYGTEFEFKDLKGTDGHHFVGINSCANTSIKGRIGADTNYLETRRDNPYNLVAPIYFEFNTNKLTINYHANGAQIWKEGVNFTTEIDVSGKDIMETEYAKYNELYDKYDWERHFCSVARIKRDGYTAKANTWKVGQKGSLEVLDYKTLQKAQDIAEYCGALDSFKKNDTTIDLYPTWIPNTYTLTYDLNGGSFNASTTQLFKYASGDAISSEIPNKAGYDFVDWKWGEVTMQPGDTIPKGWGNFTLTAQWKKALYPVGTVLNIEGSDYIMLDKKDTNKYLVTSKDAIGKRVYCEDYDSNTYLRKDGKYANTYENSEIDNYLENVWYKQLSVRLQNAIDITEIKQISYKYTNGNFVKQEIGYNNEIYNKIYRHVYLFSTEELSSLVNMSNGGSVNEFIHHDTTWTRDSYQTYGNHVINLHSTSGPLSANKAENPEAIRPSFVIDLSKVDYTVTGTVNYK